MEKIPVDQYLVELMDYLKEKFDSADLVRFSYDLDPVEMEIGDAVGFGLIVGEVMKFFMRARSEHGLEEWHVELRLLADGSYLFKARRKCPMAARGALDPGALNKRLVDLMGEKIGAQIEISFHDIHGVCIFARLSRTEIG